MKRSQRVWLVLAVCGCVLLASDALAQPEVDSSSEADVVQRQIQEEIEQRLEPQPREPEIEPPPEPAKPSGIPEVRFVLKDLLLTGNTLLSADTFAPLIDPYRDREVTVKELQAIAASIESEYRRRGYLTTIAFLPPQRIEGGVVTIQVLEGRFGELVVEGNRYFHADRIRRYWTIEPGELLRYQDMWRSIVRLNAHPDRTVQALLKPGAATGATDVVLKVTDRPPFHTAVQWDNQGTKSIGRHRYHVTLQHNDLFGLEDRLILGMAFGERFGSPYVQYLVPLTTFGTSARFGFSHSQVSPQRHFKPLGINGTSQTYSIDLLQSIFQEQGTFLEARAGLELKESKTMQQSGTTRRDRLRVIRVGPRGRLTDPLGVWLLSVEASFGIDGLGATGEDNPVASRGGARPNFFKTELELTRAQRLPWSTQATLSLKAQLSGSKLTPQEELFLGGANSVRGYPEGDYLADHGFVVRAEYLVPFRFLPAHWRLPRADAPLQEQLELVGFLDRGYGRLRAVTGTEQASRNLTGLGTGVRFRFDEAFSARLDWGFNVGDRPLTDDSNYALHFTVRYDL